MSNTFKTTKSALLLAACLTLIVPHACLGQDKVAIGPGGTLLPPGKQESDVKKPKTKLKLKTQTTNKAVAGNAAGGHKLKLSGNAGRTSGASSVLTRLPAKADQVQQLAKDKVKEIKAKPGAKASKTTAPAKAKVGTRLGGTSKLAAGANTTHPNNSTRRPQAYADKSGTRKPTGTKLTSNGAKKLSSSASSQRPGTGPRRPAAYADKSPVRKATAKSLVNNQAKKSTSTAKTATTRKPSTTRKLASSSPKSPTKAKNYKLGKTASRGAAALGLVGGAVTGYSEAKKQFESGQISKSQYQQMKTKTTLDAGATALALKKLNVSGLVLNDVVGTDPITLGAEAIGDLIHGTDNAKQSLKSMNSAWNKSLTKQAFTDPKAAGERVVDGVNETGKKVEQAAKKTGKAIEKGAKEVGEHVSSAAKDLGNKAKKAGDKVNGFFKGAFGKKKKKK